MPTPSGGDDFRGPLSGLIPGGIPPFSMPFGLDACGLWPWLTGGVVAIGAIGVTIFAATDNHEGQRFQDTSEFQSEFEFEYPEGFDFNNLLQD